MFYNKLLLILESNIKRYKDEKKLEERRHEELLQRKENKIPVYLDRITARLEKFLNKIPVYLDRITARLEKFLNKIPVYLDRITARLEKFLNKNFYD